MPIYQTVAWIQLLIVFAILASILALVRQYLYNKITIHGNLKILFANIVFIHFVNAFFWGASIVRYKFLVFIYSSNCELLTPIWLSFVFASPSYIYLFAYSGMHFSILAERWRATRFALKYENESVCFGWACAVITWLVSLFYIFCVILTALLDSDAFAQPLGLISLTSKYNAQAIIYSYYAVLLLLIITAVGDFWVFYVNKKLIRNRSIGQTVYSVSANFQMNENLMTMRLILPLDISYAILFGIYLLIGIILRYSNQMSNTNYVAFYRIAATLLLLHSAVTLAIYIQFIKFASPSSRRRTLRVHPTTDQYFKQLDEQWK
uniref:G protein-coupled receptor n=1 Tax=Globodera pallida TaxID=36090 RepID=A0A183BS33_GLOPA